MITQMNTTAFTTRRLGQRMTDLNTNIPGIHNGALKIFLRVTMITLFIKHKKFDSFYQVKLLFFIFFFPFSFKQTRTHQC